MLVCSWALRTGRAASVPACPSAWRLPGPNPSYSDLLSPLHYTRNLLQRPRPAVACCDVTQARMGVQGLLGMCPVRHGSQSTLPSGVQRCAVWLPVRAAKRFQHSNPSFRFVLPSPILVALHRSGRPSCGVIYVLLALKRSSSECCGQRAVKLTASRCRGANDPLLHQKQRLPKKIGCPGSARQRLCDAVECTAPGRHPGCPRRESISSC